MQSITSQLAYPPKTDQRYLLDSGAFSGVVKNESEHTLTYYTNPRARIEFLQFLGVTHDTPIHLHAGFHYGAFDYAITVTKLRF